MLQVLRHRGSSFKPFHKACILMLVLWPQTCAAGLKSQHTRSSGVFFCKHCYQACSLIKTQQAQTCAAGLKVQQRRSSRVVLQALLPGLQARPSHKPKPVLQVLRHKKSLVRSAQSLQLNVSPVATNLCRRSQGAAHEVKQSVVASTATRLAA